VITARPLVIAWKELLQLRRDRLTLAMMLFLPILYALFIAVFNTIGVLVAVGCYNVVARWGGGLEFDLGSIGEIRDHRPTERVVYGTTAYPTPPAPPPPPQPRQDASGGDNI